MTTATKTTKAPTAPKSPKPAFTGTPWTAAQTKGTSCGSENRPRKAGTFAGL